MLIKPPTLPNIRKLFTPDPGYLIADIDLDRADLQVVVWEADDDDLKRRLRLGVDLHIVNGIELVGKEPPPEEELIPSHPAYESHAARWKKQRQLAKAFIHGTNYGGKPPTMAKAAGVTVREAEIMQKAWFGAHPGIKAWHERTMHQLQTTRSVRNAFGFRRLYFDRIESILPEALAWVPQSTVALVTNRGLRNIFVNLPEVHILLQVHDSLVLQWREVDDARLRPKVRENLLIEIPYSDPLTIPVGIAVSPISWGDVVEASWG